MLFALIGALILIIGCVNFKKGFYLFIFYRMVLVTNITLISIPGIPLLTLEVFMTLAFFCLFYKNKHKAYMERLPFPYKVPFVCIACTYFLSTVFAYIGFSGAVSQYIAQVACEYGFVWMMWKVVDRQDIPYLLKGFAVVFVLAGIYGFYEKLTQTNPIVLYEMTLNTDASRQIDFLCADDEYRGYRVQSFFEHAIGGGCNWGLYVAFTFAMLWVYKVKVPHGTKTLMLTAAILSLPCIFFANTRGAIVYFFISILSVFNLKDYRFYLRLVAAGAVLLVIAPLFSDYANNVLSIFDSSVQDKVGGSNAEMRFDQLAAAIEVMKMSPLVGLGYKFMNVMHTSLVAALLGLESIWFRVMTQFGLLGTAANICLAYFSLIKLPRRYHSQPLFFVSLAYWVTDSLTSTPGMKYHFYYFVLIVLIKMSGTYQKDYDKANR